MTLQFLTDHKTTLCLYVALNWLYKVTTSPISPPLIAAPDDQSSATSNIPSQLHIYWLPIYTRLLMATLINFTGRQSNKALLWGLQQMCGVTFKVFFVFFNSYSDKPLVGKQRPEEGEGEREGEKKGVCLDSKENRKRKMKACIRCRRWEWTRETEGGLISKRPLFKPPPVAV